MKKFLKTQLYKIRSINKPKIFCISFQRTGTTSVGNFFLDHGFRVAKYSQTRSQGWSKLRMIGDYEKIFSSIGFIQNQVFEDNPWFEDDFYRLLYHRFPKSKFILFTRDPDKWFDSMVSHSGGKTLGNTYKHSRVYRRESEFDQLNGEKNWYKNLHEIDNLLTLDERHRTHYKEIYDLRNESVKDFFKFYGDHDRFIHCELEDEKKWLKLGEFFGIKVVDTYESHKNKTLNKIE